MSKDDIAFLKEAANFAHLSPELVGCATIIVINGKIIAKSYNSQKTDKIAINHSEIKAITQANSILGQRELSGATVYSSCEPCTMCLTALSYAKVNRIVFNKTMNQLFPHDRQSKIDSYKFIKQLNFAPTLEQIDL